MITESTNVAHSFPDARIHPLSLAQSTVDDVTTIFVVGFPDDMTEREFQNMFTFCAGFEAASLKWHCKEQDDEGITGANKKQMIGFARFRSRMEAFEAADILSGKKVDQDKGIVLKAEMAKKNLHIKRGSIAPTADAASLLSKKLLRQPHDSFSPLPSDLLSPADYQKSDPFNDVFTCSTPTTPIFADALFGLRAHSFDRPELFSPQRSTFGFSVAPPPAPPSSLSLHHPRAAQDDFSYLSKSSPVPNDRFLLGSEHLHLAAQTNPSRSTNPADQNPPCNTLYVGNLPPNTDEEELRQVFSVCTGYKRMSFRTKAQGPMCFVEFDDVVHATHALNALQGHSLTNSVKGGIRLSFSKNPLFIKPTTASSKLGDLALDYPW